MHERHYMYRTLSIHQNNKLPTYATAAAVSYSWIKQQGAQFQNISNFFTTLTLTTIEQHQQDETKFADAADDVVSFG